MPAVLFLMGPTAIGKTDLAVQLCHRLPLDLISVDSSMVYRGMDIGTGKPDPELLARSPHRLVDIREPDQTYSAADFRQDALIEIDSIHAAGRIPLLVGGTGLYFRALSHGLAPLPAADQKIRNRLEAQARQLGWPVLHQRLAALDPLAASRIHRTDSQRIQRALEVYEITGEPISALQVQNMAQCCPQPVHTLILECESRAWLHQRIEQRFCSMLAQGLVKEVRALRERFTDSTTIPALRAVGYRQVLAYLDGEYDYQVMCDKAIAATRQLARRQLTWLRKDTAARRLYADVQDSDEAALAWAIEACQL